MGPICANLGEPWEALPSCPQMGFGSSMLVKARVWFMKQRDIAAEIVGCKIITREINACQSSPRLPKD
jgi:hypothetical protein